MNIMIEVECDTINELLAHLDEMKRKILVQVKVNKCDPAKDDFAVGTQFTDDNCYGTHEFNVIEVIKRSHV